MTRLKFKVGDKVVITKLYCHKKYDIPTEDYIGKRAIITHVNDNGLGGIYKYTIQLEGSSDWDRWGWAGRELELDGVEVAFNSLRKETEKDQD